MGLFEITKKLCKEYDIKPARSRGQNFLITKSVYEKIIQTAELKKDDFVLEVGPGLGFLTERLAEHAKRVIAVELDDKLASILKQRLTAKKIDNVEVINEDILDIISNFQYPLHFGGQAIFKQFSISNLTNSKGYKVVANLPYNISSVFLRYILSRTDKPASMVLMLQKEVAERIVAKPPKMSLLAVSVQFYAKAEIIEYVGKENFWPQPEVDSAIIKIKTVETHCNASQKDEKLFFRLVKHGFSSKRKMLKNNLEAGLKIEPDKIKKILEMTKISAKARAQELSLDKWLELFDNIEDFML